MDKTVIILIGAGVCCVVIGFALFVKLLTTKSNDDDETTGNRKLLDEEYAENFKECFENTGNIEEALEQLAQIYLDNQFMYNLIVSALDYIRDEQGDYETALEKINVDSDVTIMKMHNDAIKKALNIDTSSTSSKKNKAKKPKEEIRLCAPTARAAGVLKEHSGHESSTMHIMLELNPYMPDDAGRNEENPLDADFIVVDEMSIVDTELMYHLLKAIKSGAKLILSGDPDQLESVGCGAVLRDLINSNKIPKIKLKKIMRQSEGSAVIDNCGKILAGRYDFIENDAFKIRNCKSGDEAKAYLKSCYTGDPHRTQILSTTKKGTVGTMSLNHDFEDIEQPGVWFHNSHFKLGDKVVFTKNNYDAGYCNGDIGFVETIEAPIQIKKQGEDKTIEINRDTAMDMEHADAITIHKSQGSEYDNVYIMLPDKPLSLLTRNMVNTAISRARKCVTLITINDALAIAASNKCKRNRITRLEEKLKNMGEEECQKECQEHVE